MQFAASSTRAHGYTRCPKRCQSDAYIVSTNPHPSPKGTGRLNDSSLSFDRLPAASPPKSSQKQSAQPSSQSSKSRQKKTCLSFLSHIVDTFFFLSTSSWEKLQIPNSARKIAIDTLPHYLALVNLVPGKSSSKRSEARINKDKIIKGSGDPRPRFLVPEQSPSFL